MTEHRAPNLLDARRRHRRALLGRPKFWLSFFGAAAVAALVVGAVAAAPLAIISIRVKAKAEAGSAAIVAAAEAAKQLNISEAIAKFGEGEIALGAARRELAMLFAFAAVPWIGDRIETADRTLAAGQAAATIGRDTLSVVGDVVSAAAASDETRSRILSSLPDAADILRDLPEERRRAMLAALDRGAPEIRAALETSSAALGELAGVADADLPESLRASVAELRRKLTTLHAVLKAVEPAAAVLPRLLGYPEGHTYLFFLENSTEMRPTGGFLGTFGIVTVKDAAIGRLETHDVYAIDGPSEATPRPKPPAPLVKYLGVDKWYLRDANWSPDFGVSAAQMERFFVEEAGVAWGPDKVPHLDGIIAVTPEIAQDLLRFLGPITIDGQKFTADNLVDALEYRVEIGYAKAGIPAHQRKEILAKLVDEVARRLTALPVSELLAVVGLIERNLNEKQILLAMKDTDVERLVLDRDWGGALAHVAGDYLSVIDANMAALKTDSVMTRSIRYAVTPDAGGYVATAAVTYENKGGFSWKTTRYRTYTRVYAPSGSTLIGVSGAMEDDKLKDPKRRAGKADVYQELGRTAFGAFIAVEPGEKRTLEFRYRLPASIGQEIAIGGYRLDVEKQPGTVAVPLTLDIDFGKKLSSAEPGEEPKEHKDSHYRLRTDLRTDRHFEVRF
ncbi:DUF4012 domain-containing protein [Candidatus Uhrbacteria bacterium]|nr:DUF4012 domain-containing protein [Candidatus Uhrbacteria bacterium]